MKRFITLLFTLYAVLLQPLAANASYFPSTQIKPSTQRTYRAASAFTAPAASTTDFWEIKYGSNKIKILKIEYCFSGTFGTPTSQQAFLIKRSTANTGGTATTETNIPVNSGSAAGSAVVKTYTANPSGLGTSIGRVKSFAHAGDVYINGSGGFSIFPSRVVYECGPMEEPITLNSSGETLAMNFNGSTASGEHIAVTVTWIEE